MSSLWRVGVVESIASSLPRSFHVLHLPYFLHGLFISLQAFFTQEAIDAIVDTTLGERHHVGIFQRAPAQKPARST